MRTLTLNLFKFSELSPEIQKKAIENYRKELEQGNYGSHDFPRWAIDDCALFEPLHKDMVAILGDEYYIENGEQFVFKNNRKGITFSTDNTSHLSFGEALEITNRRMFLLYLGVPEEYHHHVTYDFEDDCSRYPDTKINFEIFGWMDLDPAEVSTLENKLMIARTKFDVHRNNILDRITRDIEYRYSDESITEDLSGNDIEFTEEGEIYK
jgi:hypothetical protein